MTIIIRTGNPRLIGSVLARLLAADCDFAVQHRKDKYLIKIDNQQSTTFRLLDQARTIYGIPLEIRDKAEKKATQNMREIV